MRLGYELAKKLAVTYRAQLGKRPFTPEELEMGARHFASLWQPVPDEFAEIILEVAEGNEHAST